MAVSPAVRDLLLAPGLPGSGEKPVIIRSTGFEPAAADGVFHFTIATNAKQTPAPHQEEWYVRAESFHVPTDEAHALRTMGDSLKGILAMNNERAAELGRKLMGDFDRLFVAAGKRALAGDDGGLMKLNGDSSFVRRVNVQPVGIVAPV